MYTLTSLKKKIAPYFLDDSKILRYLWLLILPVAAMTKSSNNFMIFRQVFWHTIHQLPLYTAYPAEYADVNHYGVFFSTVVAPFALPPVWLGMLLWLIVLSALLYIAIRNLPQANTLFIYWFCANELLTALYLQQFNIAIAASLLFSFIFIEKEKDVWAAFFIMLGTFVKLYSIAGLAFFFFSKHKTKFTISLAGWSVVFFVLPMLISSPDYVLGQYTDWLRGLSEKNQENMFALHQNISLLGMVRKISGIATYSDLWLIGPGIVLFLLPYLRFKQYANLAFRYFILASALLFIVLFSTGSESSGYITALIGVCIWYTAAPWKRNKWDLALVIFVFIITSLSPTDIFPHFIRKALIKPYALKALPCVIVWLQICYELCTRDFSESNSDKEKATTKEIA